MTDSTQARLPVTPDRNSPERKRARLMRRFDEFAEAAAAATPGGWHRTHGVIASIDNHIHDDRKTVDTYRYVVATADVARVNLMGHEPDIARESANARWITLASPRNILSLIEAFREHLENNDLIADANGHYSSVQLEEMKASQACSHPDLIKKIVYRAYCAGFNGRPGDKFWNDREAYFDAAIAALTPSALSREERMVTIERDDEGKPTVWCDPEIADLVTALNAAGLKTVASCSGHGHRPGRISLADGRELIIARDFDEAARIDAMFPLDINGKPMASALSGDAGDGE